jgi:signal peptidase I
MTESTMTNSADKPAQKTDWLGEIKGLALMLLAVLGFHSFLAKPFYIPSISMMPNLLVGDRLVVSKYPFGWNWSSISFHLAPRGDWRLLGKTPEYGDIVIVVPRNRKEDLIKRVIGLPGDRIAVVNSRCRRRSSRRSSCRSMLTSRVTRARSPACMPASLRAKTSARCRCCARPCPMAQVTK